MRDKNPVKPWKYTNVDVIGNICDCLQFDWLRVFFSLFIHKITVSHYYWLSMHSVSDMKAFSCNEHNLEISARVELDESEIQTRWFQPLSNW